MKILRLALLSLFGLLVATALAAPGVIGPRVEEIWKQQLARLQGGETTEYQRGWFGAETRSRLQGQDGATELQSEIQHGPLLFTQSGPRLGLVYSETRLSVEQLAPALRTQLEHYYAQPGSQLQTSPLLVESLVGADNRVLNIIHLQPIQQGDISFDGLQLLVETDYSGALLSGSLELGGYTRNASGREQLHIAPAQGSFSLTPAGAGELALTLPHIRAESDSGPLEMRTITFAYQAEQMAAGTLQVTTNLQIPQIQSATPISALQQQLHLPQISAADLQHYLHSLLLTPAGQRSWPQVMQRPLQLQQQLAIESANGPAAVDLDLTWRGLPAGARPVKNTGSQWLAALSGSMHISAAEQALMQSPLIGQATTLRKYGLLLENQGELQMHLQVEKGQLLVNGQPLPPELFLLALMGQF